jgi:hypothetical protein
MACREWNTLAAGLITSVSASKNIGLSRLLGARFECNSSKQLAGSSRSSFLSDSESPSGMFSTFSFVSLPKFTEFLSVSSHSLSRVGKISELRNLVRQNQKSHLVTCKANQIKGALKIKLDLVPGSVVSAV